MSYTLSTAIRVEIDKDSELALAFFDFVAEKKLHPYAGGGTWPGGLVYVFPATEQPLIEEFFRAYEESKQ